MQTLDRLRIPAIVLLLATGTVVWDAGPALAHSFRVAIVAADDASSESALKSAYRGFRLATKERDGHPAETSDGHLGGLDVNIASINGGLPTAEVARALQAAAADIVIIIESGQDAPVLANTLDGDAVVLKPGALPEPDTLSSQPTLGGAAGPFGERFDADYQRVPDDAALRGYNAARRIDLAVRAQQGVDDKTALARDLAATRDGIAW